MTVYEFFNKITEDGYVGATHRDIKFRKREHLYELRSARHGNPRFQRAFIKYGEEAFEFRIRRVLDNLDDLNKAEKEILEKEKHRLYNIAPGGNTGYLEMEARRKISEGLLKPVVGMCIETGDIKEYSCVNDTTKDGFSPKNIGGACKLSVYEVKRESGDMGTNSRLSHRGWIWMYKKDFNLEEMERRRELAIRGKIRLECPVIGKHTKTGEIIRFESGVEASRKMNLPISITNACIFKRVKSAGGYVWVYADEENAMALLEERYQKLKDRKKPVGRIKGMTPVVGMSIATKEIVEYSDSDKLKEDGFGFNSLHNAIDERVTYSKSGFPYTRLHYKGYVWCKKEGDFISLLENKMEKFKNKPSFRGKNRGKKWQS
jgi:group I intron endonuclease